jgi:hypothetical protein
MRLFAWAIDLGQGGVGFALKQEQLKPRETPTNKVFPLYRAEVSQPAADAAQPGEPEDGPRTT